MNTLEREIEFRGKDENGKWYYGGYYTLPDGEGGSIHRIAANYSTKGKFEFHDVVVKLETVGQFTGLTDRNGKKIYEGDIVKRQIRDFLNIKKHNEYIYGVVYYDDEVGAFGIRTFPLHTLEIFNEIGTEDIEVIANYHDNPELTKWKFKKTGKNSGSYVPPQKLLEL